MTGNIIIFLEIFAYTSNIEISAKGQIFLFILMDVDNFAQIQKDTFTPEDQIRLK